MEPTKLFKVQLLLSTYFKSLAFVQQFLCRHLLHSKEIAFKVSPNYGKFKTLKLNIIDHTAFVA